MSSQVDPQEVSNFLQQTSPATSPITEPVMEGHTVINYDDLKKANDDIKGIQESVEQNRDKSFEPDTASLAHLSPWILENEDLNVEVTDSDKAMYVKSLLHDEPLELSVHLDVGLDLTFRSLSNYDSEVVFTYLTKMSDEGKITGPAQYATRVQECAAAIQLQRYAGKDFMPLNLTPAVPLAEAAERVAKRVNEEVATWHWPKWKAVITGLRIFETKLTICNENARHATFWQTAGAN